ncbi:MAG: hypothetical protein JNL86_11480 [Nitrospira sp.]|jgi:hypothetical protein|nr:hypothetical protein [Nitrospira sp.]MCC7472675.1 hypothetical protein [Candidatus Nomurabacteria bacterium]
MESSRTGETLTLDQVASLREKTDAVSRILDSRLRVYIETLKPLLAPRRLLGRHVGSRDDVNGSDLALTRLKELYREVSRSPFGLPLEFPDTALAQLDSQPAIYRWEYTHRAKSERDSKDVTITSPVQWVLSFESGLTLSQVHSMVESRMERKTEVLRQFVVNALVMQLLMKSQPNLVQLLAALRYQMDMKPLPGLGALSFVTITAPLTSFRPADDVLLMTTRFSGVLAFVELISLELIEHVEDPLRLQLQQALA